MARKPKAVPAKPEDEATAKPAGTPPEASPPSAPEEGQKSDAAPGTGSEAVAKSSKEPQSTGERDAPVDTPPEEAIEVICVVGPKRGRRRAGRSFGAEPVFIARADLSEDDLEALENDPALIVTVARPVTED